VIKSGKSVSLIERLYNVAGIAFLAAALSEEPSSPNEEAGGSGGTESLVACVSSRGPVALRNTTAR